MPIDPKSVVWDVPDPASVKWDDEPAPSGAIMQTIKNIPGSALNLAKGIAQTVANPIDTASTVLDAAAGGLRNLVPQGIRGAIDSIDPNPQSAQRATATADAVGNVYKNRYGGLENIKQTVITDPVGAAADLSSVLGVGGMMAPGRAGTALSTASKFTNPLSVIPPVAKATAKAAGVAGKNVLGLSTGVGAENIAQAARAGVRGDKSFWKSLTGETPIADVLDSAKQGVENMGAAKRAEYRAGMAGVKADKTVLNFSGIDKAMSDAADVAMFKGQVKNARAAKALDDVAAAIDEWKKANPADFHTPEGMDALKQRIGGIVESIPFEEKTARLAVGKVYSSIKSEITKQAPVYAKTMKSYAEASDQISEIERALSLGKRASADTAIRKLQSLSRNNVNTNYGNRLDLAKTLEAQGGNEILPAIAGQAMNSWQGRGLVGQAGNLTTMGLALAHNPLMAMALPFQSPKAMGAAMYGGGRFASGIDGLFNASGVTPQGAGLAALLAANAGREY